MTNYIEKSTERLPLTSDYVFKRIFGQEENKSALIDFLESILKIKIENLQINNPEIPKDFYDSKYGVLDLKVTLDNKIIVNVEMQVQNQYNIEQRSTFYMASTYTQQIGEGEGYENCKKVVVINILNYKYYKRNSYHSIARMKFEPSDSTAKIDLGYKKEDIYATKFLEMHIIELPKFKEKNPEIGTKLEQWLWLFIGGEEKVKKASKVNKEVEKINKKLASMSLSQEERNNYEFRLKAIRDEITFKSNAKREMEEISKGKQELAVEKQELATEKQELATEKQELATEKQQLSTEKQQLNTEKQELTKEKKYLDEQHKKIQQEKKNLIQKLLEKNFSIKEIMEITGMSENEIKNST